jgi:hypothetical protein
MPLVDEPFLVYKKAGLIRALTTDPGHLFMNNLSLPRNYSKWQQVCLWFVLMLTCSFAEAEEFSNLSGPYLGQQSPGDTPVMFAPGLISKPDTFTGGVTFSSDGLLLVFKLEVPVNQISGNSWDEQMWFNAEQFGRWTEPARLTVDGGFDDWDFQFSRSGHSLYFTSRRPAVINGKQSKYSHIWQTDFTNEGWTKPRLVPVPVNQVDTYSGYPSFTNDGTVYFHSERLNGRGGTDIYRARLNNGHYENIENLGSMINTTGQDLDPAIAPDESYLIFLSNRPNSGPAAYDLFISFRNLDDHWSKPRGLFSLVGSAGLPGISSDGKYFFFTRYKKDGEGDSANMLAMNEYWVSTSVLRAFATQPTVSTR